MNRVRVNDLRLYLLLGVMEAGCSRETRVRRGAPFVQTVVADAEVDAETTSLHAFLEQSTAVQLSEPVLLRTSICPGVRVHEVSRTHTAVPSDAAVMNPMRFGIDDLGHRYTMRQVMLCELKVLRWVEEGTLEGSNMLTWRGPWVFEPDEDCIWREPYKNDVVEQQGVIVRRVLQFHHRCRNGLKGPYTHDRIARVFVDADYNSMELVMGP